jgi:penicillin-binding protein 1A
MLSIADYVSYALIRLASKPEQKMKRIFWITVLSSMVIALLVFVYMLQSLYAELPDIDQVIDYKPGLPLRIVDADGALLAELGGERGKEQENRELISLASAEERQRFRFLIQGLLAAEDANFFQHGGVDYKALLRAVRARLTGGPLQGGGTITMQVARNFFLDRTDKSAKRKLREILLAWKIESRLGKYEILERYVNKIYLGPAVYGFAKAAKNYYGKPLDQLTLAETAVLAGLPKAPSDLNPLRNPDRAQQRQRYVLNRMKEIGWITPVQMETALNQPLVYQASRDQLTDPAAAYVVDDVRARMESFYGETDTYTRGLTVQTTTRLADLRAAQQAVQDGVQDYLSRRQAAGTAATPDAALVALEPETGAIRALIGGVTPQPGGFNHAARAWRQPASAFKPFVYAAALESGMQPDSRVEDRALDLPGPDGKSWSPHNYDRRHDGEMSLAEALARSKNTVPVQLLHTLGVQRVREFATRFGFDAANLPADLTLALGSGSTTPQQLAGAYAPFANGGFRIQPYLIEQVTDRTGRILFQATPQKQAILDPAVAAAMHRMLLGVVQQGTGKQANRLGRHDLAGKTGTSTDQHDVWFAGYQEKMLAVVWLGFGQQPHSLGSGITGGSLALPVWMRFMAHALRDIPERAQPPVMVVPGSVAPPEPGLD